MIPEPNREKKFEDTKRVIKKGKPKGRQYNSQMKKNKRINNALQNTTQKIKD